MLEACINCLIKHLGTAEGYLLEYLSGRHPDRAALVIGQLYHAELHALALNKHEMAAAIVAMRKNFEMDRTNVPEMTPVLIELEELKAQSLKTTALG